MCECADFYHEGFLNPFFERIEEFSKRNEIEENDWLEKFKNDVNSLDEDDRNKFIETLAFERSYPF